MKNSRSHRSCQSWEVIPNSEPCALSAFRDRVLANPGQDSRLLSAGKFQYRASQTQLKGGIAGGSNPIYGLLNSLGIGSEVLLI